MDHPTGGRSNRLIDQTSPYLLQHAHDPVDWYPWGAEALTHARTLDRPVFLSVGYAACHWCHVMHRESFANATTAQELNAGFVSIKVDREERPDVDHLYMDAVQSLTGSGGWPMSMFLTPDGRPFYGGTYFPDTPRHGLASFRQVLAAIGEAWAQRRDEIEASATTLAEAISRGQRAPTAVAAGTGASRAPDLAAALDAATTTLLTGFDARTGGWGGSPKFPQPMVIEQLIREHLRTGA
ncbi:MAG: thioredoxin domain-containing protein, partial [Chloroflexi bacterium]|nr:thioredoxin domain-containing protein [Chloroflexota bacterium]